MSRFDVRDYAEDRLGLVGSSKSDTELVAVCPFCNRPKLYISTTSGAWICFKCKEAGSLTRLVAILEGVPVAEALTMIREGSFAGPAATVDEIKHKRGDLRAAADRKDRERIVDPGATSTTADPGLPDEFIPVWDRATRTWRIPAYLRDRGIRARTAAVYGLGYCESGRYAGRLIFPAHVDGRVRTFQGRAMYPTDLRYLSPTDDEKSSAIYGYDEAIGSEEIVVAEGPFDVLALYQHGVPAVCLMGKMATPAQAVALKRGRFTRATMMLDPGATKDAAEVEMFIGEMIPDTRIAQLPGDHDPAEATRDEILTALAGARRPSIRHRIFGR